MGAITKSIIDKILFDLNRDKGKDVITVTDLWNYFNTLQSIPEGGGGGGDMYKATYDPLNLSSQVIVEPISKSYLDFIDLVNKSNVNGNNPSLSGLIYGQTYQITNLTSFGYSSDVLYYVTAIKNEAGDVIPDSSGVLTSPSSSGVKSYPMKMNWTLGAESPVSCSIENNLFVNVDPNPSFEKQIISGAINLMPIGCVFQGIYIVDVNGTSNTGANFTLESCIVKTSSITLIGDFDVELINSDLTNSSVDFTNTVSGEVMQLVTSELINSQVFFLDNGGTGSSTVLENCFLSNITIYLEPGAELRNCTFIGGTQSEPITIPNGYTANGKIFIANTYSDFEKTFDSYGMFSSGGTLTLPLHYEKFLGIYRFSSDGSVSIINKIITNGSIPFKLYGCPTKRVSFSPQNSGGSALPGHFFTSFNLTIVPNFDLANQYDYLEFKKELIDGSSDALRITDYGILG